jgi:2-dehydropantoate 2-reductase
MRFLFAFYLAVGTSTLVVRAVLGYAVDNKFRRYTWNISSVAIARGLHSWTSLSESKNGAEKETKKPSVAIIGSGAVGGYYGARLWESGAYNVMFQMRGHNFAKSTQDGFRVTSIDGDVFIPPGELQAFENPEQVGGPVDWVIISLKSSSLDAIPELVYPLLKPKRTRILAIMNGLIEEDLVKMLKEYADDDSEDGELQCCSALYGGMALVCSNRLAPGHINHSYAGHLSGGVAASDAENSDNENKIAFQKLWAPTTVETAYESSILSGRWRKCLWNLPFNGISVAMGGITVDKIVNDPGLRRLADLVMDETVAAANADLVAHGVGTENFLSDADKAKLMQLSDSMGPYRTSTMIDFVEGRPMEVKYLFSKPLERAKNLGVPVPHLETLVAQIEAIQRIRQVETFEKLRVLA